MASSSKHSGPPASENEQRDFPPTSYTVGWISALPDEFIAAQAMLDEEHKSPTTRAQHEINTYVLGRVGKHNVVMACLDDYGPTHAAKAASNMMSAFPRIRFGLMVGVGGGIPSKKNDIRLGDIVVSKPTGEHGGVVQYDLGKMEKDGFHRLGSLNKPPSLLRTAMNALKARYDFETQISERATTAFKLRQKWQKKFSRPSSQDRLFGPDYEHVNDNQTCDECDTIHELPREEREDPAIPEIHYGNIASGGSVIKKASDRDHLGKRDNAICFDMEAAGLMDDFPCLVVRGICDYSDSHKNEDWQPYAAAVAAAYAKELLLQIPPESVESLRPIQNVHWIVPKSVNPFFTGRESILQKLRNIFCQSSDEKDSVQKRFVIHGIGGAGKSEVCVKFAHDNKNKFWGIFWVDASTTESVRRGMISAAQKAFKSGIKDVKDFEDVENVEDAKTEFSNSEHSWLLILDNADNPEINYEQYFPTGNTGNIIMTTRNHDCIKYGIAGEETFEKLDLEDAVELLLKSSGIKKESWDKNKAEASKVAQLLAQHALAITQAGASISQGIHKLESYSRAFRAQRKEVLHYKSTQGQSTYSSVYATFEVSAKAIKDSKKEGWENALALLQILGYFYRDNISEEIFTRAWISAFLLSTREPNDHITDLTMWHVNRLRTILPSQARNPEAARMSLGRARQVLRSFSLVSFDHQTSAISMHPLAHTWVRDRLQHQEQVSAWATASSILALSLTRTPYDDDLGITQAHFEQCFNLRPKLVFEGLPGLDICRILFRFGETIWKLENQQIHEIKSLLESRIGVEILPQSQNSRDIHMISCASLRKQKRIPEAIDLIQEVVTFDKKSNDKERLLESLQVMASLMFELGRRHECLNLYKKVFRLEKVLRDQFGTIITMEWLATSYDEIGQLRKARNLLKRAAHAEICKKWFLVTAFTPLFYELSNKYEDLEKFKKAIVCMKYALYTHKKALLYEHEHYITWNATLARFYIEDSQGQKAVALLQKAISNRESTLGLDNEHLLTARVYLANLYILLGHPQKAIPMAQEVARIRADTLPPDDKARIWSENELSRFLELSKQNKSQDGVYIPDSNAVSLDNLPDIDPDNLSDVQTPDISDYSSCEISDPSDDSESDVPSETHSLKPSRLILQAGPGVSSQAGREFAPEASSIRNSSSSEDLHPRIHEIIGTLVLQRSFSSARNHPKPSGHQDSASKRQRR